jgi:L-ascorbate metabolism protein UlaG (beta-lactamase superfamily)
MIRLGKNVRFCWLGHSAFKVETLEGKTLLIDPWLTNPLAPEAARSLSKVDMILVTHGHGDHLGETVALAKEFGSCVVCNNEIGKYLRDCGLTKVEGINTSGTLTIDNIAITLVPAFHSSTIVHEGRLVEGGEANGFVVRLENNFTFYHAGDTGVFGDMRLIAELYAPELVLLPIGGYFTMGPREAAKAVELLQPEYVVGMHYGTFPVLSGTPAELRGFLPPHLQDRVLELSPGEVLE